jgi:Tfp pilus assembly protein PilF
MGRTSRITLSALALAACLAAWTGAPAACAAAQARGGGRVQRATPRRAGTDAARLVEEGAAALERGDEAAARAAFTRALASDPENVAAHTYLGVLADRAGDLKGAEKHFAAAALAAPFLASARNNYGAVLMRQGRGQLAAAQFEASLKLERDQPNALVNLAQIRFESGRDEDLRAARELFGRAMRVAPDVEIARSLVAVSLRLGEKDAAAAAYREYRSLLAAAGGAPAATAVLSAKSRAELGAALLSGGLADEAVEELGAAVAADPSDVAALVSLARAHLRRREIPAAGRVLEGALSRGLGDARLYAALAEVYEAGGYVENAIPAMRLAVARDPRNESYRVRYGLLLNDTKAPAAAVIRLRESLTEFPRSSRLWLALGIAQLNDGKNEDATRSFERALELDPASSPALAYLGAARAERGQYEEAAALYERAIGADPRQAAPYYLAADALLKQAEIDEPRVARHLARAVELDPDFASARLALAKLHVRGERFAEAAAEFERVVRLDPQSAEAFYQLGRVYVRLKRTADAQRAMDAFKRLSEAQKEKRDTERQDLLRRLADVRF